jgi:tRNA-dihydrouridine synthase B
MIGRAAQGRPWLFREIEHFLNTGTHLLPPRVSEIHAGICSSIWKISIFSMASKTGVGIATQAYLLVHPGLVGSAAFAAT